MACRSPSNAFSLPPQCALHCFSLFHFLNASIFFLEKNLLSLSLTHSLSFYFGGKWVYGWPQFNTLQQRHFILYIYIYIHFSCADFPLYSNSTAIAMLVLLPLLVRWFGILVLYSASCKKNCLKAKKRVSEWEPMCLNWFN